MTIPSQIAVLSREIEELEAAVLRLKDKADNVVYGNNSLAGILQGELNQSANELERAAKLEAAERALEVGRQKLAQLRKDEAVTIKKIAPLEKELAGKVVALNEAAAAYRQAVNEMIDYSQSGDLLSPWMDIFGEMPVQGQAPDVWMLQMTEHHFCKWEKLPR